MKRGFKIRVVGLTGLLVLSVSGLSVAVNYSNQPHESKMQKLVNNPVELGKVHWLRDFDEAVQRANAETKPILILFQEVPGCMTCKNYGTQVLSHPLVVDAIENEFVPLAIYNNIKGKDRTVLTSFGEPTWNNPVVRIVNAKRTELAPRLNGNYTLLGLATSIRRALEAVGREVPAYMTLLIEEEEAKLKGTESATFSMYCFWTGEKKLSQIDGVVSTAAGFMQGREVVRVQFVPSKVSFVDLLSKARQEGCASSVFVHDNDQSNQASKILPENAIHSAASFRKDSEPKYYLSTTDYRFVPMTPLQAARVNAAIGEGRKPGNLLSPSQWLLHRSIKQNPKRKWLNAIDHPDFLFAWKQAMVVLNLGS